MIERRNVSAEDRTDLAVVWRVVQESGVAAAASTLLGVSLLGYEGQLVEIEAVAVSGGGSIDLLTA